MDALIGAVKAALEPLEDVRVAYVFGSRVTGGARPESDLDLGVRYGDGLDAAAREAVRRRVVGALTDALGSLGERADVVDLDRSDAGVAFSCVSTGRRVLARTEPERIALEVRVGRRYEDDAPRRALFRRAAIEAGRRLGERSDGRR